MCDFWMQMRPEWKPKSAKKRKPGTRVAAHRDTFCISQTNWKQTDFCEYLTSVNVFALVLD